MLWGKDVCFDNFYRRELCLCLYRHSPTSTHTIHILHSYRWELKPVCYPVTCLPGYDLIQVSSKGREWLTPGEMKWKNIVRGWGLSFAKLRLFCTQVRVAEEFKNRLKLLTEWHSTASPFYPGTSNWSHSSNYFNDQELLNYSIRNTFFDEIKLHFGRSGTKSTSTEVISRPTVHALDDIRWWWWSNWWNEWLTGYPKYPKKTCPNAAVATTDPVLELPQSRTRPAAVGSRPLAAWATAQA